MQRKNNRKLRRKYLILSDGTITVENNRLRSEQMEEAANNAIKLLKLLCPWTDRELSINSCAWQIDFLHLQKPIKEINDIPETMLFQSTKKRSMKQLLPSWKSSVIWTQY